MILEAQQIYESLQEAGLSLPLTHGDLYRPGKADALRVELSSNGKNVSSIHIVDKQTISKYWTIGDNNKNRFPVSKLEVNETCKNCKDQATLTKWAAKSVIDRKSELELWTQNDFPDGKLGELSPTFKKRLKERSKALTQIQQTTASRFLHLLKIFIDCSEEQYLQWVTDILRQLKCVSLEETQYTTTAQKMLVSLAYTSRPEKGSRAPNKAAIPIIWDLEKEGLNDMQGASPVFYEIINTALLESEKSSKSTPRTDLRCSITGRTDLENQAFQNPSLANLGPTRLYSRNKAIKSFGRYGKFGADAFQLSHSHGAALSAAISALTSPDRKGKTWTQVNASNSTTPDLLLAFQASMADHEFASAMGTDQREVGEAGFEELCKRLIERTKGKATDQLRGKLSVVVLREVDTANTKVIFHRNLSIDSLEKSAHLWQAGCKNFTSLKLHIPTEKGKPAPLMSSPVLNPGSLPSLTKTFHFRDGRSSDSSGGISFPDALQLLLTMQSPDSRLVKRCLGIVLRRLGPLLERTSSIKFRSPSELFKMHGDLKWNILKAQSLFSVLITSSNRTPNIVMNSIAYQLGQLCAAYDLIHAGYCHQERGGDLPPKLLGNICFQSANRNPTAALSQLSQRAAPHLAWAKRPWKNDTPNDKLSKEEWAIIRGRSAARNINDHSEKIHEALISNQSPVDDLFRSELLLGYMAGFPKKNQTETTNQD